MAFTILKQTVIMLILITTGIMCSKTGIISKNANRDLSKLVLQVVNPVMIFMSYQTAYRPELVRNLLLTFALSIGSILVTVAGAYLFVQRKEGREHEIERFSAIYSNCGFMGIPLIHALFDMEGVFYLTAFITVFNIVVWTHGIILISGERSFDKVVKVFYSPTMISIALGLICFFFRLHVPAVPAQALGFISDLNTPLAMIVSGVTMADTSIFKLIKKPRIYYVSMLRLVILPFILSVLISPLDISNKVKMTVVIAAAAPPAAMCTLQCIRYGKNSLYSSEIFTAGTIFSVLTLPAAVSFTEYLTNVIIYMCSK